MYNSRELQERYDKDPAFNQLVQVMTATIIQNGFSPMELRQAVFFATLRYEQMHYRPIFRSDDMFTFSDAVARKRSMTEIAEDILKEQGEKG